MKDERFAAMFENKEFEIDEFSQEYLTLHPMSAITKQPSLVEEHFEPVMEDDNLNDTDVSAAGQSSEDNHADGKSISGKRSRVPRLYEVKDERHAEAFWNSASLAKEDSLSLGERVAALGNAQQATSSDNVKFGTGGSCEISFVTRSSAKYKEDDEDKETMPHKKRGIQSLKLNPDISGFQGSGCGRGGSRRRGRGRGRGQGWW